MACFAASTADAIVEMASTVSREENDDNICSSNLCSLGLCGLQCHEIFKRGHSADIPNSLRSHYHHECYTVNDYFTVTW